MSRGTLGSGSVETAAATAPADAAGLGAPFRLGYQPALDGVRAIAVMVVVVFHLDVGLFEGGYLGVSVFFTLSGFLITALLLGEASNSDDQNRQRIDLGRFYLRRIKRLLPASIVTLGAVMLLAATGVVAATASLRGDITAAAWNVFNWRELQSGDSYADLFVDESPVAHFWSLAIEEQFYLVWPIIMVVLTRVFALGRRGLLGALAAMFALSSISAVAASPDVAYLATHTRAAEILAGAILATWMSTARPLAAVPGARSGPVPRWWRHLAWPALTLVLLAALFTPTSSGWAYSGGLPCFALVSVALIAGLQSSGSARSLLAIPPLVALGRISYGVYLVHWPVFVVLDERRLGADGWSLAVARLFVTGVIASAMYVLIERPIRSSERTVRPAAAGALAVGAILTVTVAAATLVPTPAVDAPAPDVLGAVPAPRGDAASATDEEALGETLDVAVETGPGSDSGVGARIAPGPQLDGGSRGREPGWDADPPASSLTAEDVLPASTRAAADLGMAGTSRVVEAPVTIAVFGDSVPAWLLRDAAESFVRSDAVLLNGAREACDGMVGLPRGRDRRAVELTVPDDCSDWRTSYPATLAGAATTDVSLLVLGQAPVVDRYVDGRWQGPCESIDWYLDDLTARIEFLRESGTRPVLAIPARFGDRVTFIVADDHEQRIGCIRRALAATASQLGVDSVDLDEILCPNDDCEALRTLDGVHVDPDAAPEVLDSLVDQVVDRWRGSGPALSPDPVTPLRTIGLG